MRSWLARLGKVDSSGRLLVSLIAGGVVLASCAPQGPAPQASAPGGSQQAAAAQDHDIIADAFDIRQQMTGKQQAHPLVVRQIACQLQHFFTAGRIHAIRRLVAV